MAKKPLAPKGKFNFYWVYGIVAAVLIGSMLLTSGGNTAKADVTDFYKLAEKGYIEKLVIIKNLGETEIYLKKEKIDSVKKMDPKFKYLSSKAKSPFTEKTADLVFTTPSGEAFGDKIEELRNKVDVLGNEISELESEKKAVSKAIKIAEKKVNQEIQKNKAYNSALKTYNNLKGLPEVDATKLKQAESKLNAEHAGAFDLINAEDVLIEKKSNLEDIENKINLKKNALDIAQNNQFPISYDDRHDVFGEALSWLLFPAIMIFFWIFMMRKMGGGGAGGGGGIFSIGKSKAKVFEKGKGTNTTFNDVAGLEGAKEEIEEIVDFLKHPKKYTELGAKIPKGALLVGPPGTGKTLLAKAVAGEAKVPFFSMSGSDFVEMFVGVGASRVRDLFKQAKEKAPSIIFIDEIDAIGRARGKNANMGSNDERENTLNQLLTEMDGFGTNSGVIILAATNRADVLDSALMRAGRFDRQIYVDMPDINERKEIFEVHLKPIKLEKEMDIDFLSRQTPGFSGADIANLCNEAALIAARKKKKAVNKQDFLDAVDRIVGGLEKKNKIITPNEKRTIAFHEAGHATTSWLLEHASPLVKVTIVPRGKSLGAAWYLPEERQITTTEQLLDEMCSALGGRAAEKIIFGKISTGALSDLEKVTKQAYAMVSVYGLSDKLGNISYYDSQGNQSFTKPYSESRAQLIDEEVSKMIEQQYQRAIKILTENKDKLTQLAEALLEDEVIFKTNLEEIFGQREWDKTEEPIIVKPIKIETESSKIVIDSGILKDENNTENKKDIDENKAGEES